MFNFFKKDKISEFQPIVDKINSFESEFEKLTDVQLREKTQELKKIISLELSLNKLESNSNSKFENNSFKSEKDLRKLDEILPESFALIREASKRTLNQRHFDVQLLGGIALHNGMSVEMMTGEGKTLVATLPAYLNALTEKGVHIITVNDYLAQRDVVWMGQIYHFLGLSIGCIAHEQSYIYDPFYFTKIDSQENEVSNSKFLISKQVQNSKLKIDKNDKERDEFGSHKVVHEFLRPVSRKEAYNCDIVYGTNHEFGFDYLRDNLAIDEKDLAQRELNFGIIDEVDSILIDEARTPLIISSYEKEADDIYYFYDKLAKALKPETDFTIDEKRKSIFLTEEGQEHLEKILKYNPYQVEDLNIIHHLEESLKANFLFKKNKDYIVKNNQVVIVDEFTGRLMFGRRWSGGLHQAVESKENVSIQPESKTVASITIQNLFKRYKKLSGMSGTVMTSAEEFYKVYGLESIKIPTNKKCVRVDNSDKIFMNQDAKWNAVVEKIKELYSAGRPVLVGTTSIEKNELLHTKLTEFGIPHNILNAKNHEEEGSIIAQAGKFKAVTIATNMAGRGVDIVIGGIPPVKLKIKNEKVKSNEIDNDFKKWEEERNKILELGGLFVLGTERHEARRIDNQLRGRAGRQGDPGATQFYVSLDDELIKIFGGDSIKSIISKFKIPEDQAIENNLISKVIEEAQGKVEGLNFDIRKHLVEYDNVVNSHREKIYDERKKMLLNKINPEEFINNEFEEFLKEPIDTIKFVFDLTQINVDYTQTDDDKIQTEARKKWDNHFNKIKSSFINFDAKTEIEKEKKIKTENEEILEKNLQKALKVSILRIYDYLWSEHLSYLDEIKENVGYRAYGQRDPLIEFKKDALESFDNFHKLFRFNLFQYLLRIGNVMLETKSEKEKKEKIGRNEPCSCGSGKKYKKCCGK